MTYLKLKTIPLFMNYRNWTIPLKNRHGIKHCVNAPKRTEAHLIGEKKIKN